MPIRILSKAGMALMRNEKATSHSLLCTSIQNTYRGEIIKVKYNLFTQGVTETLEFLFLDDTKLRVSFFVGNDGKSKITMKEL